MRLRERLQASGESAVTRESSHQRAMAVLEALQASSALDPDPDH